MFITKRNTGGVGMLGEEALWKRMWCVERLKNSGETLKTFSKLILSQFLSWLIKANVFLVWLNTGHKNGVNLKGPQEKDTNNLLDDLADTCPTIPPERVLDLKAEKSS